MKKFNSKFQKRVMAFFITVLGMIAVMMAIYAPEAAGIITASIAIVPIWGSIKLNTFKELKAEEVADLDASEQIKYFNDLNIHKAEQINQLKIQMKADASKELATKINDLREEIVKDSKEQMKSLQKALEIQGMALNKLMLNGGKAEEKTLIQILEGKADELKAAVDNRSASIKITVDKTTVLTSAVANSTVAMREPAIGQIQRAKDVLRQLFKTGIVSAGQGGVVRYIDQVTNTNNAAMQTEGNAKAEGVIAWGEFSLPLQVVAEWIKASRQSLADFAFIDGEIRNKLIRDLAAKVEDEVWDGTGTPPELKGVYTYADEYVAVASGITDANIFDLAVAMKGAVEDGTNYMANVVVINSTDVRKYMKAKKDSTNNYVLPYFVEYRNGSFWIDGMLVVESSQVTADTMLVGDFDYATLYGMGTVDITIGYDSDDFTKNLVTILAEERLALLVRSVDTGAFHKETGIAAGLVTLAS